MVKICMSCVQMMIDPDSETTPTNQGTTTGNVSTIYNQFLGNTATFPQNAALATMPFGPNTAPVANVALPPNFPTVSLPAIGLPSEIVPMFNTMPTIPITNMPPHMMNLPNSNLPAQFAHPTFVGTNVFVPNMTAAPPTPAMQPAGSQNQNWGQVQASSNANNDRSSFHYNSRYQPRLDNFIKTVLQLSRCQVPRIILPNHFCLIPDDIQNNVLFRSGTRFLRYQYF